MSIDFNLIVGGDYRLVRNSKRVRKIRKRGDHIRWSNDLNGWIWTKFD